MKKLLAVCCLMVILCVGCATVETVTPPSFSFKSSNDSPLMKPDSNKNIRFVAKDGKGKATQDNVTVEVSDIVGQSGGANDYSISFKDGEQTYNYSVFPMLLVLSITNNTDHIVTLERTIVKIEDDKQNDYPMANTLVEAKQKGVSDIREMFKAQLRNYRDTTLQDLKDKLNGSYKAIYDQFAQDIRSKIAKGVDIRFPTTTPGKHVTMEGINENLKHYSPSTIYSTYQKDLEKHFKNQEVIMEIKVQQILKQVDDKIPNSMKGVITNGVYQPINILPGRAEKVLVPFSKRKEDEVIKKVNIGVYDLPTMVNEAGIATKRAKFNFEMVAQ